MRNLSFIKQKNHMRRREMHIAAFKRSKESPQVRPNQDIDSKMWLEAARKADKKAPSLLIKEGSEDSVPDISISTVFWLLVSVPVCLVIWYVYDTYLGFLT